MKSYYTINEVTTLMGTLPNNIRKWIKKGLLRATKNSKGQYKIGREDIIRFIKDNPRYDRTKRNCMTVEDFEGREKYGWFSWTHRNDKPGQPVYRIFGVLDVVLDWRG